MDNRDWEDIAMQARENVNNVLTEAQREQNDAEIKRQLGQLWASLPPEMKTQLAQEQPDLADGMSKLYGNAQPVQPEQPVQKQGNPWGTKGETRQPPQASKWKKGR